MPLARPFRRASAKSSTGKDENAAEKGQGTREKERNSLEDSSSNDKERDAIPGETVLLGKLRGPDRLGVENVGPDEIHYKTCKWWQTGMLMIAETISLGILSLPSVLSKVGLVPGIILLLGMGIFATYSGYIMYQFWNTRG
jgi:hypothetical protein